MYVTVAQLYPTLVIQWSIQSTEFSRPEYWSGQPFPSPGDLPNPGIERRSPTLQADSLPAELQGKPKCTGVGSLSLLQWICLTQESNQGLLNCRWILNQLRYQGSPNEAELDVFLEFCSFFYDPTNVGNLIPGSSAFSKTILYIWKFSIHILLKPSLKDFENNLTSM